MEFTKILSSLPSGMSTLWIFVAFLFLSYGLTDGQLVTDGDNNTVTALAEDAGSGDVDSEVFNVTESIAQAESSPILIVTSPSGSPCLLASLNATMQVSYKVLEGIVHENYLAYADIQLPTDVNSMGICGENSSQLLLKWGNNTFHLNMTFTLQPPKEEGLNATWSLTSMSISYDLSNGLVFPASSEQETVTVERSDLQLFVTQIGHTQVCDRDVRVLVGSADRGVTVNFHDVQVAAFGVTSADFPQEVDHCPALTKDNSDDEDILVPLIVASCLSAIVIIVVIAYVISRRLQRAREQSEYSQMQ